MGARVSTGLLLLVAALPFLGLASEALAHLLSWQCQADPSRAWMIGDSPMPVCTRCLGLYVGAGVGALLPIRNFGRRQLRPWLIIAPALMLADVLSEWFGLRPAWPGVRFATGLLLSGPLALAWIGERRSQGATHS